ncbi:MAG: N-acetylmuramic acid 6-phosphate etherase [Chitinophagaceae bacterium]
MSGFQKITEKDSAYRHLEKMSVKELLIHINHEDHKVPEAIAKVIPSIEALVSAIVDKMIMGGRLFYIGAGTSGRLGIVDASECPPTFGVPYDLVSGIIAGGNEAMFKAVEFAEDQKEQGWLDLQKNNISKKDVVVGITASGTTPYVMGALHQANESGILTGSITCNQNAPVSNLAKFPVEIVVGPEFVTGSTRMKSGTAEKLVLNMISTSVMIQLGRVEDNKMVHMQLTNEKLIERGIQMLQQAIEIDRSEAKKLIEKYGSVKMAINHYQDKN